MGGRANCLIESFLEKFLEALQYLENRRSQREFFPFSSISAAVAVS